jgi:hypothetical protein
MLAMESNGTPVKPWPTVQPPAKDAEIPNNSPPPTFFQIEAPVMLDHLNSPFRNAEANPPTGYAKYEKEIPTQAAPFSVRQNVECIFASRHNGHTKKSSGRWTK